MRIVNSAYIGTDKISIIFVPYMGVGSWQIAFSINDSYSFCNNIDYNLKQQSTLFIISKIKEFIENTDVHQIIVFGDTKYKRKQYKKLFNRLKIRYKNSKVYHSLYYSRILFPINNIILQNKIDVIKKNNFEKIKSVNNRGSYV